MNTIYKIISAAFAALLILASCERVNSTSGNGTEESGEQQSVSGVRSVIVSFGNKPTRTDYDKTTFSETGTISPTFEVDDQIQVFPYDLVENKDEWYSQICEVKQNSKTGDYYIDIDFDQDGFDEQTKLLALYPAQVDVAYVESNDIVFFVPNLQTGEFKDANFCTAEFNVDDTSIEFKNQTALFVVTDIPNGAQKLCFKSLCRIGTTGQRTIRTAVTISYEEGEEDYEGRSLIEVTNGDGIPNPCFIAVQSSSLNLEDINIDLSESIYGDVDPSGWHMQGGFSPKMLIEEKKLPIAEWTVGPGKVYRCSAKLLHEYVATGQTKTACLSIGATEDAPSDCLFFAWGDIVGYRKKDDKFVDEKGTEHSFTWENCPFNGGNTSANIIAFNGVKNTVINSSTLRLKNTVSGAVTYYDAAFYHWGGAWRLPKSGDFSQFMVDDNNNSDYSYNNFARYMSLPGDVKIYGDQIIDFPLSGYVDGTTLKGLGSGNTNYIWTASTPSSINAQNVGSFYVCSVPVSGMPASATTEIENGGNRRLGLPIRPVSGVECSW